MVVIPSWFSSSPAVYPTNSIVISVFFSTSFVMLVLKSVVCCTDQSMRLTKFCSLAGCVWFTYVFVLYKFV